MKTKEENFLKAVKAFSKNKNAVGWFSKEYGIIHVDLYRHYEYFKNNPEYFPDIAQEIEQFEDMLSEAQTNFIESVPEDEHPAWHNYEVWQDEEEWKFEENIRKKIQSKGWKRIGRTKSHLHIDDCIDSSERKELQNFADMIDCELAMHDNHKMDR